MPHSPVNYLMPIKTPNPTSRIKSPALSFELHFSKFKPDFRKRRWDNDKRQAYVTVRGKVRAKPARKSLKSRHVKTQAERERTPKFVRFLRSLPINDRAVLEQHRLEELLTLLV